MSRYTQLRETLHQLTVNWVNTLLNALAYEERPFDELNALTNLLRFLYCLSQDALENTIQKLLTTYYSKDYYIIEGEGGIIALPINNTPCLGLIAHLDTYDTHFNFLDKTNTHRNTFKTESVFIMENTDIDTNVRNGTWFMSLSTSGKQHRGCLGGDDRNGVAILLGALYLSRHKKIRPPVLFFPRDEEIGCKGTNNLIEHIELTNRKTELECIDCLIQIDRGQHLIDPALHSWAPEVVYYNETNPYLKAFMYENLHLTSGIGSFTDVLEWSAYLNRAGCNIAAGYRYEHTYNEETNVTLLNNQMYKILKFDKLRQNSSIPSPLIHRPYIT